MVYLTILLVVIAFYAVVTPIVVFRSVKFGMKVADKPEEVIEEPVFHLPKKKKEPVMTPEEKRTTQILANIDRYDGSSVGQVPIKRENR